MNALFVAGILIFAAFSFLLSTPAAADSNISFDGFPIYAEGITRGGVLSDYGSHYGIKANVTELEFCKSMTYSCLTSISNGQLDRMRFLLKNSGGADLTPSSRSIHFNYWGWSEEAAYQNGATASAEVFFTDTDILTVEGKITNYGESQLEFVPSIIISGGYDISKSEGASGGIMPQNTFSFAYSADYGAMIAHAEQISFSMGFPDVLNIVADAITYRAIVPSFAVSQATNDMTYQSYSHSIESGSVTIPAGESWDFSYSIVFGDNLASVESKAAEIAKGSASKNRSEERDANWENFFAEFATPHTVEENQIDLFKTAATALRMNLYAPRNNMQYYCSVPSKPAFNFFWCWDTPFHARGQCEFGTVFGMDGAEVAEQNLLTQFSGQAATGMVYIMLDDTLNPYINVFYSQPPVHAEAIMKVYESDKDRQRASQFLKTMYDSSASYLSWWETERDMDLDGLCEFRSGSEAAGDDNPRYDVWGGQVSWGDVPMPAIIESVDLNSWLYMYYDAMAKMASELGLKGEIKSWEEKRDKMGGLIESLLWSEKDGCWYDLKKSSPADAGTHIEIATPVIWMPALAGATKNETRIRRVIEEHMLNPEEFFGPYPFPSVAYNSPYYDKAEEGCYWQGQLWISLAETGYKTLYKYGYEREAREAVDRLLEMMSNKGGLYENYNAETGSFGWGFDGPGVPSAFQFGWSSMFAMEMLLERYERSRVVMPDEYEISGYIKNAKTIDGKEEIYSIETGEYEVPRVVLKSLDGSPLSESKQIRATFADNYDNLAQKTFQVTIKGTAITAEIGKSYQVSAKQKFIPGFEIVLLFAAIAASILVFGNRKRN